ncbi:hypothetical protein V8D89_008034 [Ganoderma adspersum]
MIDPTYPLFPVFSFIAFVLVLVPIPWHLEAWNSATCFYMMWSALSCLNGFVNAVVWANDAIDHAPVWCEISTRVTIAASVGIPAAAMCINQRLYQIARVQAVMITRAEKRRAVLMDALICVLFPFIVVALSYVVQGHRFNILEELGCFPALYNTLLTYFLVDWWPLLLAFIASIYCVLSLLAFNRRRAQFSEFLSSRKSSLTLGRYFRLMALSTTSLLLMIPISSYGIYLNITTQPLGPWRSWSDTHFDFGRVEHIPAIIWRASQSSIVAHELNRWLAPACSSIFFLYFGVASEARRNYSVAFRFVMAQFGDARPEKGKKPEMKRLGDTPSPAKVIPSSDVPPPYDFPKPPRPDLSTSLSSTTSFADDQLFNSYKGLASTPSLAAESSPPTPIYDRFARRSTDGGVASVLSLPLFLSRISPLSPSPSTLQSPADSMFSHDSEHSAISVSFTDIEAAYGARVSSFISLEVQHSSEPPTPLPSARITS